MNTHLADNLREECQRQFAKRVESYKAADTRIHFFYGNCCVAATKRVDPTTGFDGICHNSGCFFDVFQLGSLQFFHNAMGIL